MPLWGNYLCGIHFVPDSLLRISFSWAVLQCGSISVGVALLISFYPLDKYALYTYWLHEEEIIPLSLKDIGLPMFCRAAIWSLPNHVVSGLSLQREAKVIWLCWWLKVWIYYFLSEVLESPWWPHIQDTSSNSAVISKNTNIYFSICPLCLISQLVLYLRDERDMIYWLPKAPIHMSIPLTFAMLSVLVFIAAITNYHKCSTFKQHKFITL